MKNIYLSLALFLVTTIMLTSDHCTNYVMKMAKAYSRLKVSVYIYVKKFEFMVTTHNSVTVRTNTIPVPFVMTHMYRTKEVT